MAKPARLVREPTQRSLTHEQAFELVGDRFLETMLEYTRSRMRQRFRARVNTVDGRELTPPQVDALRAIVERDRWTITELARDLQVDQSTATRIVEVLVRSGYVTRAEDPQNRRCKIVTITDHGNDVYARIEADRRTAMRDTFCHMDPAKFVQFTELFEEYVAILRRLDNAE